jgi:hypothetical protein
VRPQATFHSSGIGELVSACRSRDAEQTPCCPRRKSSEVERQPNVKEEFVEGKDSNNIKNVRNAVLRVVIALLIDGVQDGKEGNRFQLEVRVAE